MSKPVARVGDSVLGDGHPHPMPHTVTGIWQSGSANTYCNNRSVVICDSTKRSLSAACVYPPSPLLNTMAAQTGSPTVFANNFPVHRSGDLVEVCGMPSAPGQIQTLPVCSLNTYA